MKMASLFDGSGGFPLAAFLCGIEPVYASEVEPYPTLNAVDRHGVVANVGVCVAFAQNQRNEVRDLNGVAGALAAEPGMKQQTFIAQSIPFDTTQVTSPQNGNNPKWGDPCHPLAATGHPPCVVCAAFKAGQGAQARGIGWQEERSPTLTASNSGTQLAPTVCVAYDARGNGDGKTASTITGDHENRITDYTTVVCMAHGQANAEVCEKCAPCLNCNHEQPIVFDKEVYNSGVNATGGHYISEGGPAPTLRVDGHPPGVCVRYIVRRLTPTECARLQGFSDRWGDIDPLDISDEQEVDRWRCIYKTYCIINGLKVSASILSKPERLKKWHDKLHTDSAEYKMWGNGIALPNALYVMQGIEEVMNHV